MRRWFVLAVAVVTVVAALGVLAFTTLRRGEGQEDDLLEKTNRKFERLGFPTLPPGTSLVWTPPPPHDPYTPTPGPSPTPIVPACAQGSLRGIAEIVERYGSATSSQCADPKGFLVFTTQGKATEHGGVAVFNCGGKECSASRAVDGGGSFSFYPAPLDGPAKVVAFLPPETLLIMNHGQVCFNLRTGEYNVARPCYTEPTIPPGPPWPVTPYMEPTHVDLGPAPTD